jgi:hypothetical protein
MRPNLPPRRKVDAQKPMKRIYAVSLFILLAGCAPAVTVAPTVQIGVLTLDMPAECRSLIDGLCIVSEPGEYLGDGQTIIINEKPAAVYLEPSTAIKFEIQDWTLILDPGEGKPFSVGMSFPNAKLYPQGKNAGMSIEHGDKKCNEVEGAFTDDILQSAEKGPFGINPIKAFDIRFTMRCNNEVPVIRGRVKLSY